MKKITIKELDQLSESAFKYGQRQGLNTNRSEQLLGVIAILLGRIDRKLRLK